MKYPIVNVMTEEELITHLETHHSQGVSLLFRRRRKLSDRKTWETYHDHWLHRANPLAADHEHEAYQWTGWEGNDMVDRGWQQQTRCVCLQPPRHADDCPGKLGVVILGDRHGPSAREKLWERLDIVMGSLKAKTAEHMGEARVEAAAYAYALAVLINPGFPDVDAIRKEAVRRWKEAQK